MSGPRLWLSASAAMCIAVATYGGFYGSARGEGRGRAITREQDAALLEGSERACETCHAEIAREWRTSAHALSFANAVFRSEYDVAPSPFCVGCHAPIAVRDAPASGVSRGVGCLTCHESHRDAASETAVAPRTRSPVRACADCHEFDFDAQRPDGAYARGQRLQRTMSEWSESPSQARGESCASCHFERGRSEGGPEHTVHTLPGARDASMLSAALSVTVSAVVRSEAAEVRVELRLVSRAGHAVPTGDLYRTLNVHVEDADRPTEADGRPRDDLAALRRHFEPSESGLVEVLDDRVPADGTPRVVVLHLPGGTTRVRWEVRWLALSSRLANSRGLAEDDVDRPVAEGVVAVAIAF